MGQAPRLSQWIVAGICPDPAIPDVHVPFPRMILILSENRFPLFGIMR
jgi:hypothetical protein